MLNVARTKNHHKMPDVTRTANSHHHCETLWVVLLCKGHGADKASYRPHSGDESQWWGRRDALVRCAASFLFGPDDPMNGTKKQLVLLFDEDFTRLRMTIDDDDDDDDSGGGRNNDATVFPKEQIIIQLWKAAAQNLRKTVKTMRIKCVINLDPTFPSKSPINNSISDSTTNHTSTVVGMDTKRAVLEYLQKHCSIEFPRGQRINSNPEVVLRKTNRKALLKIWDNWNKQQQQQQQHKNHSLEASSNTMNNQRMKEIDKELLQFDNYERSPTS